MKRVHDYYQYAFNMRIQVLLPIGQRIQRTICMLKWEIDIDRSSASLKAGLLLNRGEEKAMTRAYI